MRQVVVLIDPEHEYGAAFIDIVHQVWGLDTVCLYTSRKAVFLNAYRYPALRTSVGGHYLIEGMASADVAALLRQRYHVAAVIPHIETSVTPAAELAARLGLSWGDEQVVARFRDKYSLKTHLTASGNGIRVNHVALVRSVADIRRELAAVPGDRIVLKPNDGFGNADVGFFDRDTTDGQLQEFLDRAPGTEWLLEEFIAGTEYYVNGQVDGSGSVTVLMICRSQRISANGKQNVLDEAIKVDRTDPAFEQLAKYTTSVIEASGLIRSPFHAELIIDDLGPCLVEVGARLCGADGATDMNIVHGGRLNVFQLAAHYYLSAEPFLPGDIDWRHYDSVAYTTVYGTSYQHGRIGDLAGVAEVEAMPEFVRWIHKPAVGDYLQPTTDMFSIAYLLNLAAPTQEQLQAAVAKARALLVFNGGPAEPMTPGQRVRGLAAVAAKAASALPKAALVRPKSLRRTPEAAQD